MFQKIYDALFTKFPTRAIIFEQIGNGMRIDFDKVTRLKRRDGTEVMMLKKRNDTFQAPSGEVYDITKKGKKVLFLWVPKEGVYVPSKLEVNPHPHLVIPDSNMDQFYVGELKRLHDFSIKEESWLKANFPLIAIMVTAGMLAFSFIIIISYMPAMFGQIAAAQSATGANLDKIIKLTELTLGVKAPPIG